MAISAGLLFKQALQKNKPLQIIGTMNAYFAKMAETVGVQAIYLSGAGVANASLGYPDLAITSMHDVLIDANRITSATSIPLLVDIDTGWGGIPNVARAIQEFEKIGVAAVHIEDQVFHKRCGHRPNKTLIDKHEMMEKITAAANARKDKDFVIIARTDAVAVEGMPAAINRAKAYLHAGADMIFAEALTELSQYQQFKTAIKSPLLANMTEFGKTPLFSKQELVDAGVDMVLYPLSTFRAANQAGLKVMQAILEHGHQGNCLDDMQTREELYQFLDYQTIEKQIDLLNKK